jgi:hypothetical protein
MLIGGLILAVGIIGAYVLLNSEPNGAATADYGATAIFKLTATKEAIISSPEMIETLPILMPTATLPPTNTPRSVD